MKTPKRRGARVYMRSKKITSLKPKVSKHNKTADNL